MIYLSATAQFSIELRESNARLNSKGDKGHPWRTERMSLIEEVLRPLSMISDDAEEKPASKKSDSIPAMPAFLTMANRKGHSSRSKAFDTSNFNRIWFSPDSLALYGISLINSIA